MANIELISYSLKHMLHRTSRSILTIISIFVGITTIFIFISFGQGLFDYVNELKESSGADIVTVIPKGIGAPGLDNTFYLTEDDITAIEKTPGVFEATGTYAKVAEVKKGKTNRFVFIFAYDPQEPLIKEVYGVTLAEGRDLRDKESGRAVAGYNYRIDDKIFPKGIDVNEQIEVQGTNVRIIGFFNKIGNPQDDSNIYVSNDFFEELYPNQSKKYNQVVARVDLDSIDIVIERIEDRLRKSKNLEEGKEDFFVTSFQDLLESFTAAIDYIVYFVIFIALISVLVSAVNTANTTITSVLERVKEIGVMKAIGAKNKDIFKIFVFESGFLGFVAGCIGVIVGFLVTSLAAAFLESSGWGFLAPHYSWVLFIGCILFATITGAISGIIPAWKASKIQPVTALRYE
ncbi:MAG: ABC transporter permease [Candidatus Pacearchaeota archaeon]